MIRNIFSEETIKKIDDNLAERKLILERRKLILLLQNKFPFIKDEIPNIVFMFANSIIQNKNSFDYSIILESFLHIEIKSGRCVDGYIKCITDCLEYLKEEFVKSFPSLKSDDLVVCVKAYSGSPTQSTLKIYIKYNEII